MHRGENTHVYIENQFDSIQITAEIRRSVRCVVSVRYLRVVDGHAQSVAGEDVVVGVDVVDSHLDGRVLAQPAGPRPVEREQSEQPEVRPRGRAGDDDSDGDDDDDDDDEEGEEACRWHDEGRTVGGRWTPGGSAWRRALQLTSRALVDDVPSVRV